MSSTIIVDIVVGVNGSKEDAQLICDKKKITIELLMRNGYRKSYSDHDFYKCFAKVREDHPDIVFYCKGAKVNVHTSSMSSQMSLGLKAYELALGKTPSLDDVVYIFDYAEGELTNDYSVQREFYMRWIKSEKPIDGE
ncbi:hypothetical protein [Pseudomonas fluorescens]|uniref:hypothetical protein n=1 Tax=Pseudomonas TaxID=286 RepID=UPI003CFDAAA1